LSKKARLNDDDFGAEFKEVAAGDTGQFNVSMFGLNFLQQYG
jgi:hypothetical protein